MQLLDNNLEAARTFKETVLIFTSVHELNFNISPAFKTLWIYIRPFVSLLYPYFLSWSHFSFTLFHYAISKVFWNPDLCCSYSHSQKMVQWELVLMWIFSRCTDCQFPGWHLQRLSWNSSVSSQTSWDKSIPSIFHWTVYIQATASTSLHNCMQPIL